MYDKWRAYGQAKTANILFSVALAEKLGSKGLKVFVLHPGPVQTNLDRYISPHDYADLCEFGSNTKGCVLRSLT